MEFYRADSDEEEGAEYLGDDIYAGTEPGRWIFAPETAIAAGDHRLGHRDRSRREYLRIQCRGYGAGDSLPLLFTVAQRGGLNGTNLLTLVDPGDFDPASNEKSIGLTTGTTKGIESLAYHFASGNLYAVDYSQLGVLDRATGIFTSAPRPIGSGQGPLGRISFPVRPFRPGIYRCRRAGLFPVRRSTVRQRAPDRERSFDTDRPRDRRAGAGGVRRERLPGDSGGGARTERLR